MPVAAAARLGVAAATLRDVCLAALAATGLTDVRGYLYPGQPPVDLADEAPCTGMLAVYASTITRTLNSIDRAAGALGGQRLARRPAATLTVIYATCVDVFGDDPDSLPPTALLDEMGAQHMEAGWALMNAVQRAAADGTLAGSCEPYDLGALTPLPVTGQSAGWTFALTISLDGYSPADA